MTGSLAIGIGSFSTIVTGQSGGQTRRLPLAAEEGRDWMPSAVWSDPAGGWQVGSAAVRQAATHPGRFEQAPLRLAGEGRLLLGDALVPATDVIAALLRAAAPRPGLGHATADHAMTAHATAGHAATGHPITGHAATGHATTGHPITGQLATGGDVRLTYPAHWGPARQQALAQAAASAGLAGAGLIAEPVAAAAALDRGSSVGGQIAILDIGGFCSTASVLRAAPGGYELAGPAGVREQLGGQDIDQLIVDFLGSGPAGQHADWQRLLTPDDGDWRQAALRLRTAVRAAKHALSGQLAAQVAVPVLGIEVQLTRPELDAMMAPVIDEMVELLTTTLAATGVPAASLKALYLIGGCAAIPLVADRVWELLRVQPQLTADPAAASALGAVAGVVAHRLARGSHFRGSLVGSTASKLWRKGCSCTAQLALQGDGALVHAVDAPAQGADVAALAAAAGQSLAAAGRGFASVALVPARVLDSDGGLERRYTLGDGSQPEPYLQRYLVAGDRWLTITAPERVREVADRLVLEATGAGRPNSFELQVGGDVPQGWWAAERLDLIRTKPGQRVTAESFPAEPGTVEAVMADWCARTFPPSRFVAAGRGRSVFLARHSAATVTYRDSVSGSFTRIWFGVIGGRGYRTMATVPRTEYLMLPLLESLVFLT